MTLTGIRVSLGLTLVILTLFGIVREEIFSAPYWIFLALITGAYVLFDMTTAAAACGFKGAKLQKNKSEGMVNFERLCLVLSLTSWAGVHWLDICVPFGETWSAILSNALTAISIGIIIKFLDFEWTLMGKEFAKEWYGTFSVGFIICFFSAFGIAETPPNEMWFMSFAKICFSLGVSVLFALSSRMIDAKIRKYSLDG